MLGHQKIEIGQVWRVPGRADQPALTVAVHRIDEPELTQQPLNGETGARIIGIEIFADGGALGAGHVPVSETAFRASRVELLSKRASGDTAAFDEGYAEWKAAHDQGEAGAFEIPLGEIYALVLGGYRESGDAL